MGVMILKSFWLPLRNIWNIIKIFWPYALLWVAYIGLFQILNHFKLLPHISFSTLYSDFLKSPLEVLTPLIIYVMITLHLFLTFFAGIVNWHRTIVLHEPAKPLSLFPQDRVLSYFVYVVLFSIALVILFALFEMVRPILSQIIIMPLAKLEIMKNINQMFLLFGVFTTIFSVFFLIVAFIFRRLILLLPKVAVEARDYVADKKKVAQATGRFGWIFALFIVGALPFIATIMFPSIYSELTGLSMQSIANDLSYIVSSKALGLYSALAFATLLSLFYRDRVKVEG